MPREIKSSFEREIETLIQEVVVIDGQINPYEEYPVESEGRVWESYKKWLERVQVIFHNAKTLQLLPHDFFFVKRLELPRQSFVSLGAHIIVRGKKDESLHVFRTKLHNAITMQVEVLKSVCEQYRREQKQVVIHIEKNGLVWRDDPKLFFYKSQHIKVKRIRILISLSENNGSVTTESLMKKLGYGDRHVLSKEKNRLNALLRKRLGLPKDHDVIWGRAQGLQGYAINPAYTIVVEPKHT